MVKEYKIKATAAKTELEREEDISIYWELQDERYKPTLEHWWCGCPSFTKSANHLCKHLIRKFIGPDQLASNKPPMPFYGEVWRQTVSPVLWIAGLHSEDKLTVRDLRPETQPPIRDEPSAEADVFTTQEIDTPPQVFDSPVYDSSNEEEDDENEDDKDDGEESDDDTDVGAAVDDDDDGDVRRDQDLWDDGFRDDIGSQEDYLERLAEREEKDEHLALLEDYLDRWLRSVREIRSYPIGHPHHREAPPANLKSG